jgi:hypothetical protein
MAAIATAELREAWIAAATALAKHVDIVDRMPPAHDAAVRGDDNYRQELLAEFRAAEKAYLRQ